MQLCHAVAVIAYAKVLGVILLICRSYKLQVGVFLRGFGDKLQGCGHDLRVYVSDLIQISFAHRWATLMLQGCHCFKQVASLQEVAVVESKCGTLLGTGTGTLEHELQLLLFHQYGS